VHPDAKLVFDTTKPDGTPRKLLDVSRLHNLGWKHKVELEAGIMSTYQWFIGADLTQGNESGGDSC
jgi:nucleoside-diphosphate-sugar epimerase